MGVAVDVEQVRRIDPGVDLGGREASVTEQLLKRAQVRPAGEQMRGETVPKRVRRQAVRQAQAAASGLHCTPDQVRIERPAAGAEE